ncbi:MAG: DUF1318 domain-containing protein [candidate division Zixibacteria bacterium]|nr:DUF1318 domain-containing protein [Candidatus Tariuqbacter arcticus]
MKTIISISTLISLLFISCAVKLPKITATGERTALENQIVGSYRMIEEQAFMVASLRGEFPTDSISLTQEKRRVLLAFQRQRFNADDVTEFKGEGTVGEALDGFLEIIPNQKYESDSIYQVLVDKIVAEENEDRRLIMRRIIELHPEIDPNDKSKVGLVYSRMKQEASQEGTWIQQSDGSWKKK